MLYQVHLTISKIRTRNVRSQPRRSQFMLENQTPKSISYTKLKFCYLQLLGFDEISVLLIFGIKENYFIFVTVNRFFTKM
jgi:hypothetical protein